MARSFDRETARGSSAPCGTGRLRPPPSRDTGESRRSEGAGVSTGLSHRRAAAARTRAGWAGPGLGGRRDRKAPLRSARRLQRTRVAASPGPGPPPGPGQTLLPAGRAALRAALIAVVSVSPPAAPPRPACDPGLALALAGVMPSPGRAGAEEAAGRDLLAADLRCSLFAAALGSYKRDSVLRPFPAAYARGDCKDFEALVSVPRARPRPESRSGGLGSHECR